MNYSFIIPSLLILLIIMGYYFFRPRLPIRLNRAFLAILAIDIGTEIFECVAARLNETWTFHSPVLLAVFYTLFFLFYFTEAYMFFVFTVSVLDSRLLIRSNLHFLAPIVYFPCAAITMTNPFTGWLFRIQDGFVPGPLSELIYVCSISYLLFSIIAVLRHTLELSLHEMISLLALQLVLLAGSIIRMMVTEYIVTDTISLMGILIIFLSFLNPDLYMSDRGFIFNLTAFRALLSEYRRRKKECRILGFTIQNYSEHRELIGGRKMDVALAGISRWLAEQFPKETAFYLRNGFFVLVGQNRPDLEDMCARIRERFAEQWSNGFGKMRLAVSFVEADTEKLDCTADRLVNTLLISQNAISRKAETEANFSLSDSIGEISQKLDIRRCLEHALDNDKLEVFLQPLIDSNTGKRIAAEALVRLRNDEGTLIRPDLFISMAEQEGQIVRLGEQVLTHVCRFIRDHDMQALGVRWINVNLSPVQFMAQSVPDVFAGILKAYGVGEDMIHLEITEQSMIDFSLLREQIMELHDKGFEFSLDDYGSGYSNLTRVRQYPFSNIKIDMEVVRNYCREPDALLPAIIRGFKEMNLSITAEGIETQEMAAVLKGIGCDYLQGYYYSRPVPMDEFVAMGA